MIDFFNTITGNNEINFIVFIFDYNKKCIPGPNFISISVLYYYETLYSYCILTILFKIHIFLTTTLYCTRFFLNNIL